MISATAKHGIAPDTVALETTLVAALEARLAESAYLPIATYRWQFNAAFTFTDARRLVPYLHSLGISTCYASPYLQARPGSTHGYDVIDPRRLNPEIGSDADYAAFVDTLQEHNIGQLLDIVPNHMGVSSDNPWWMDMLQHGPSSLYAPFFDIDWQSSQTALRHKILLPVLGEQYGCVLENGELRLAYNAGAFTVHYYDHRFPLEPRSTIRILEACLPALRQHLGDAHPQTRELQSIATALGYLPLPNDRERWHERRRESAVITQRLTTLVTACPTLQAAITRTIDTLNGQVGEAHSFDGLHAILDMQPYRLSFWRTAVAMINYRRFFDISDLAGVRVEDTAVFEATHELILRLLEEGKIHGVRIDHPDGLADPPGYFHRLQRAYVQRHCRRLVASQPGSTADTFDTAVEALATRYMASAADQRPPLYVVIEKILEPHENLPTSWPVYGTTGYDFLNQLNGLFVERRSAAALRRLFRTFYGSPAAFPDILYSAKKFIIKTSMASELRTLGELLNHVAASQRRWRDCTVSDLAAALREIIACFPVYRTYIAPQTVKPTAVDRAVITAAVMAARQRNPTMRADVFDYIEATLCLQMLTNESPDIQRAQRQFIQKFQQLTGPVMAKGLEDTAFYRYTPLASLNEVGGDPDHFGMTVAAFHRLNTARHKHWPRSLLATATHDTKRGEDVRARLNVLSELPQEWRACVQRWYRLNQPHRLVLDGQPVPAPQEEYLLYQTLLGAWPLEPLTPTLRATFCQRLQEYMRKALREAKVHTSWLHPHADYEQAVDTFIATLLDGAISADFLADFRILQEKIAAYGLWNGLSQTLLKLTVPGVPDIYQGCELWDLSLVDPDNRRPVDYDLRQRYLTELQQRSQSTPRQELLRELLHTRHDGRIKLYLIWQTLTFRRAHADLFRDGEYVSLEVAGGRREHVCAFARVHHAAAVVVVAPRLLTRALPTPQTLPVGAEVWGDTHVILPEALRSSRYRHLLSAESVEPESIAGRTALSLGAVFADVPVALLESLAM